MTLLFDRPTTVDSPLFRWDSRWKLTALVIAIFCVAGLETLLPLALAALGVILLLVASRVPFAWYSRRLALLLPLLAALFIVLPFVLHDDGPALLLGPVRVSWFGFLAACALTLRALVILSLVLILLTSTPLPSLFKAAHALYIPGFLVQVVSLSYRYLFLIIEEFKRLRIALRLRGFRNRGNLHSYHTIGNVSAILLLRGSERAERVGQAMRCRGFDGHFRCLTEFRTTGADIGLFFLIMVPAVTLVIWDRFYR
jgi:cobalt/nickel transport system permease protein